MVWPWTDLPSGYQLLDVSEQLWIFLLEVELSVSTL